MTDDAGEPGSEGPGVVVADERRAQPHEHLGGGVLGVLPLPEQMEAEPERPAGESADTARRRPRRRPRGRGGSPRRVGVFRGAAGHHRDTSGGSERLRPGPSEQAAAQQIHETSQTTSASAAASASSQAQAEASGRARAWPGPVATRNVRVASVTAEQRPQATTPRRFSTGRATSWSAAPRHGARGPGLASAGLCRP